MTTTNKNNIGMGVVLVLGVLASYCCCCVSAFAFVPASSASSSLSSRRQQQQQQQRQQPTMIFGGLAAAAAAHTIASAPMDSSLLRSQLSAPMASPMLLAKMEVREGVYGEYEVEVQPQSFDDAASKFKSKEATAKGKVRADCGEYNTDWVTACLTAS
jgi:hypothetical protein